MPIVKRSDAHYDSATPVSLAVFGSSQPGSNLSPADATNRNGAVDDSRVEIIRAANGDISKINLRCDCGKVASLYCDYES